VLFSHPEIVELLNGNYECAWQEVAPVPRVDIDFGNGRRLERTLSGNIATWILTPEGGAVDLLPGLVSPHEFLRFMHGSLRWSEQPFLYEGDVRAHHLELSGSMLAGDEGIADMRKFRVEQPLKDALRVVDGELDWDTAYNKQHRYQKASALLAAHPLAEPATLTKRVYREILDVDLDDPYLGLAPYVLGGEAGRH